MNRKRIIFAVLTALCFALILYLTFQDDAHTSALSNAVRQLLRDCGIKISRKVIRSNAHYAEYFLLGLFCGLWGRARGWSMLRSIGIVLGLAFLDESIRLLIPTREFELADLIKDWVGGSAAVILVNAIRKRKG